MPHIILEHSSNVKELADYQNFFESAVNKMVELGIVPDGSGVKCRFTRENEFFLSDPDNIFIHAQISLLEGRDKEKLKAIGAETKKLLKDTFKHSAESHPNSFSVEIREMDKELYQK